MKLSNLFKEEHIPGLVVCCVFLGSFILLLAILFLPSEADEQTKGAIVGAIISALTTIVAFYFGSSSGSRAKDRMREQHDRPPDDAAG